MKRKRIDTLTPDDLALLPEVRDEWIANALRTEPMTREEYERATVAIGDMHRAAVLEPPDAVVYCADPISAAIAGCIASAWWYLHDQGEDPAVLTAAAYLAVQHIYGGPSVATRAATWDATRAATRDVTWAATRAATGAATRAATWAATGAATGDATEAATGAAIWDATRAATEAATEAATDAATGDATWAATGAATRAATRDVTWDATRNAIWAATRAATRAATMAATSDATEAATDAATWAATGAAIWDATRAATGAATGDATWAATWAATGAATGDATWAATGAAIWAATRAATRAATVDGLAGHVSLMVGCLGRWSRLWSGGSCWSATCSYVEAFRRMGLDIDWAPWLPYAELCRTSGPVMLHRRFAIVTDRPSDIHRDDQHRPHCETGPAIRWRTGRALYYWHGTEVPAEWIEDRANLDPQVALTHDNIEQRRAAAEIVGWDRILDQLDPTVVHEDPDPEIGTLLRVDLPDAPGACFLRVRCGTGRTFCIPVPDGMTTARQANAWTWGLDENDYQPEVRT